VARRTAIITDADEKKLGKISGRGAYLKEIIIDSQLLKNLLNRPPWRGRPDVPTWHAPSESGPCASEVGRENARTSISAREKGAGQKKKGTSEEVPYVPRFST
jgi:hypothetical protein